MVAWPCLIGRANEPAKALLEIFDQDRASGYLVMRRLAGLIARDFMAVLAV